MKRVLTTLVLAILAAALAVAQMQEQYLDLFIAKVRPEKRAEFDAIGKKISDANRKHKGDSWLSYQVEYGEQNTVYFVSVRQNYAAIDQAFGAFMGALKEAYGPAAAGKMMQDVNNCVASSRGEIRRRRWDLSFNVPQDPAAAAKVIGDARWLRVLTVRIRPGRTEAYEAQVRDIKKAMERDTSRPPTLVSQAAVGAPGTTYYFAALRGSLAGFDTTGSLRDILGEAGYQQYLKSSGENVLFTETMIGRFLPDLSNPPEEVAKVSLDFWRPKPATAAKPKPKAAAPAKTGA
jgi:hypothetical protein